MGSTDQSIKHGNNRTLWHVPKDKEDVWGHTICAADTSSLDGRQRFNDAACLHSAVAAAAAVSRLMLLGTQRSVH